MSELLEIRAFGGLTIRRGGQLTTERSPRKVNALLLYLACSRCAYPREVLAELFWPDRPRDQSLANLRAALNSLRQYLAPYVNITRQTVAMNPESSFWLDVAELESRLEDADVQWAQVSGTPTTRATRLERALDLYQGDFLEGFYIDSLGFEDWALLERERLRFRVMEAFDALIACYASYDEYATGIEQATRLLQLDTLREKTHRQLMMLLARSGQRSAALAQYETCKRLLDAELGVNPTPDTTELYEQIRDGVIATVTEPISDRAPIPASNLPPQSTSFIGRETDIVALVEQLNDPDCRLLTLVGMGGIGKTRLALQVARQKIGDFAHGVCFVELAPLDTPTAIPTAVAAALRLQLQPGRDTPQVQLLDYLHEKEMLVVLDSFEHLLDGVDVVDAMLAAAPKVKVMVTSRQALNLAWEWQYPVQGLSVPLDPEAANLEEYSAIRLFVERARRVHHTFSLLDNRASVIRICQMVEGMPLGIELAAAWLRIMPCHAIAAEIVDLESPQQRFPDRHRSLRTMFDHTWDRLSEHEQTLLRQFSVFQGGFRRDAAEKVMNASRPSLAALVNKSLLRVDYRSGRYTIHELLRQYAAEKLAEHPAETEDVLNRHTTYYADFLHQQGNQLKSERQLAALDEIGAEIGNIRVAWDRAVAHGDFEAIGKSLDGLSSFYNARGWYQEAEDVYKRALAKLETLPETPERTGSEIMLHISLAIALMATQGYSSPEMGSILDRARNLCRRMGETPQLVPVLLPLTGFYGMRGEWQTAREIGVQALTLAERMEDPVLRALIHLQLGWVLLLMGEFGPALDHLEHVIGWYDPQQHQALTTLTWTDPGVTSLTWASWALWFLGYPEQALQRGQAALSLAQSLDHPLTLVLAQQCAGCCPHLLRREPQAALVWAEASLAVSTQHKLAYHKEGAFCNRGWALLQQGQYEAGIADIRPSMEALRASGGSQGESHFLSLLAEAYGQIGHCEEGVITVDEALALVGQNDERYYEAESHRIKGELLLKRGDEAEAEKSFHEALEVARHQSAKSLELRATVSLCRLWQQQGKAKEAQWLLADIYGWFTEGLDTADLQEAKTLLDALS
jgi:predicted ATPase/DNA-binding SARP family transcriptional activator